LAVLIAKTAKHLSLLFIGCEASDQIALGGIRHPPALISFFQILRATGSPRERTWKQLGFSKCSAEEPAELCSRQVLRAFAP